MKITLKDFGPISNFEFDLEKDLHVIFGKNNIGKSYAITAIYLVLKNSRRGVFMSMKDIDQYLYDVKHRNTVNDSYTNLLFAGRGKEYYTSSIKNAEDLIRQNITSQNDLNINKVIEPLLGDLLSHTLIKDIENSLRNSFNSIDKLSNALTKKNFQIQITSQHFNLTIYPEGNDLRLKNVTIKNPIDAIIDDKTKEIKYSYLSRKKDSNIGLLLHFLYLKFTEDVFHFIDDVFFLPSSRSGLYQALSTFSALLVELSKSRNFLTNKVELPNISEPVSDYFLSLSNINQETSPFELEYDDLVKYLEEEILKGKVLFNQENKKIYFQQQDINLDLDLSFTSSMISEIAPIVAYIKYIIRGGKRQNFSGNPNAKYGVIFIEEPEAHLHPEVQVKLMELFALLTGKNVKIVMTSHSNYMFNKLSNLLLENKIDNDKVSSYLMHATDIGSVSDMLSMKAEAEGMNDENFADVAEMLYDERIKIYEQLNKEAKNAD